MRALIYWIKNKKNYKMAYEGRVAIILIEEKYKMAEIRADHGDG